LSLRDTRLLIDSAGELLELIRLELLAESMDMARIQVFLTQHDGLFRDYFSNRDDEPLSPADKEMIADYLGKVKPLIDLCDGAKSTIAKELGVMRFRDRVVKTYQG
jgi:hypothetical protein